MSSRTDCLPALKSRLWTALAYSKSAPSGLPAGGLVCSTDTSTWLGHQSLLVRGAPVFGVGEGRIGFSDSDTRVLLPDSVLGDCGRCCSGSFGRGVQAAQLGH